MTQRLPDTMKWLWCILIIYSGPTWSPVKSDIVKTPPKNPATVEAQAKFFQDFFSVQLSPYKIEFGHVCEDPNTWEQRYEKKDYKNHRDMGKVRWGDKKGGYGEHYWDLNHAGHAGNHEGDSYEGTDENVYHEDDGKDNYDGPGEHRYETDEYGPEIPSKYDDNNRAKRAHTRTKNQRKEKEEQKRQRPQKEESSYEQSSDSKSVDEYEIELSDEKETAEKKSKQKRPNQKQYNSEEYKQPREKNQVVLVLSQKEKESQETSKQYKPRDEEPKQYVPRQEEAKQYVSRQEETKQYVPRQEETQQHVPRQEETQQYVPRQEETQQYVLRQEKTKQYVPYEGGAGIRQHFQPEVTQPAAQAAPRLFLEPSTGHVVDRATGQAYVLQPLIQKPIDYS